MKNNWLLFLFIILLSCCKKEDSPVNIQPIQVLIVQRINEAALLWEPPKGYSDSLVEYTLFLGDSLIASHLLTSPYKITGLSENSSYSGKIEAFAGNKKIAESPFKFTTLRNQPPGEFKMIEIAICKNSVLLIWNQSSDPEKTQVVYDVYLNNELKLTGTKELSCEITSLKPASFYLGEISARDSAGNCRKTEFSFTTLDVEHSILVHRFFKFEGYERNFAFYIPRNYDPSISIPLVINLHGANGNAWNEIRGSYFKNIADRENFILMMPQALLGSYNNETIYQWNAHYIFPWDDVSLLNYLIDYMYTRYHVDLSRIYMSGMSNGGYMTYFAARGLQERIAAIAPISGLITSNVFAGYKLNRPIPLCYMHGTADPIVRIDGSPSAAEIINFWANNNQCLLTPVISHLPDISTNDNSTVTLYQYNGYSTDSEIQYYVIEGGGHSVPGIEPGANMDINAYEVIWIFFSRHSYPDHSEGKIIY